MGQPGTSTPGSEQGKTEAAPAGQPVQAEATVGAVDEATSVTAEPVADIDSAAADSAAADSAAVGSAAVGSAPAGSAAAEAAVLEAAAVEVLRAELAERTGDLQRLTAEYANYRKRVERDRAGAGEQAIGLLAAALLPVLDDLDRAREHDDLVGPAAAMAEQLSAVLAKFGLSAFGETGDAFDPARHEAVTHTTSAEVTVPTCVGVMRRGYLLGERLLRAALVAVADPE